MSDHIVKSYDEDLSQLKTMLAQMGGLVEQQLDGAEVRAEAKAFSHAYSDSDSFRWAQPAVLDFDACDYHHGFDL